MTDLTANVAALGALSGVDCGPLVSQAIANGARVIVYPPGAWTQNDADLTGAGSTTKITVRGAGPAATSIASSVPGVAIFRFAPAMAREAFIDIADLQLVSGPGLPGNTQDGYGILVVGPAGTEIGKGVYRNLWGKNFTDMLHFERHNNACPDHVTAEYCGSALVAIDCGDLDAVVVKAQQGTGAAISLIGTADGQASHRAEGARLTGCGANTQGLGLVIENYSFVHVATSSFSTCGGGAFYLDNVTDLTVVGGEFQSGPTLPAMSVSATCRRVRILGSLAYDSGEGLFLAGSNHTVHGLHAVGNTSVDLLLLATDTDIAGGQLLSTGAANSLMEFAPAAANRITGTQAARAMALLAGGGSTRA